MIILRISGEYLAQIRRNCSSNVTVRLKTPKLGVQSKFIWFLERYISESANRRKVSILQVANCARDDIRKNKIFYFKVIHKSIMAARKLKKNNASSLFFFFFLHFFIFEFLNVYDPKTHLIKAPNFLDWFFQTI